MSSVPFFTAFSSPKKIFRSEVRECFKHQNETNEIITEGDIKNLPLPVQRYFRYTGWIGKKKIYNAKIKWDGAIKMKPDKKFVKLSANQYNFTSPPTRIIHLKNVIIGGRDKYMNGHGNMLIKLLSRFTVADESGEHMDKSALITYLNDVCLLIPGALFDDQISWESIDDLSAIVRITDSGYTVSAKLFFSEEGQLVNFITNDRYMDNKIEPVKWSTPVKDYINIHGIKIPGYGEGVWHLEAGDFNYVKFNLIDVQYNVSGID